MRPNWGIFRQSARMFLKELPRKFLLRLAVELGALLEEAHVGIARRTLPSFANAPKNLRIDLPRRIVSPDRIYVGDNVWLGPGCLLIAVTRYPGSATQHPEKREVEQRFDSKIVIGSRVVSTGGLQIAAHDEVVLEDDVLLATNVNITDGLHGHENANEPYKYQMIERIAPIVIKRGCWIGQNVVILPGVTIGEYSIVGANSVVTESMPPRSISVGAPAKVIRTWDEPTGVWVPVA